MRLKNKTMRILNLLFALVSLSLLVNCSGSGGTDEVENINSCKNVNNLQIVQNGENLQFSIASDLEGPFEISFGLTQYFNPESSNSFVVNDKTFSKSINDINGIVLDANKSYSFAVRRYCSSSSKSNWGFEKHLTISGNFCKTPYNLRVDDYIYNKIQWDISSSSNGSIPSKYQIQYGSQGFALGSGTTIETTTNQYNAPFISGTTYQIYVRSYCSSWGDWIGPITFTASNTTACVPPTYANFTVAYTTATYFSPNITWDNDGISQYEYSLSTSSAIPTAGMLSTAQGLGGITFTNLYKTSNYYFYVRKKCSGNTSSSYFGPYLVKFY